MELSRDSSSQLMARRFSNVYYMYADGWLPLFKMGISLETFQENAGLRSGLRRVQHAEFMISPRLPAGSVPVQEPRPMPGYIIAMSNNIIQCVACQIPQGFRDIDASPAAVRPRPAYSRLHHRHAQPRLPLCEVSSSLRLPLHQCSSSCCATARRLFKATSSPCPAACSIVRCAQNP